MSTLQARYIAHWKKPEEQGELKTMKMDNDEHNAMCLLVLFVGIMIGVLILGTIDMYTPDIDISWYEQGLINK